MKLKFIILFCLVSIFFCFANAYAKEFLEKCIVVKEKSNGIVCDVKICKEEISRSGKSVNMNIGIWGRDWGPGAKEAKFFIRHIQVDINGENVHIPYSAYSDLANPNKVTLKIVNGARVIVEIDGGETSTHYIATLTFEKGNLINRLVKDCEFPDEVWEETKYNWIEPSDR